MSKTTVEHYHRQDVEVNQGLELETSPDSVVQLWVKQGIAYPEGYLPLLERLLRRYADANRGGAVPRYRFLGARRESGGGGGYLCMSFHIERNRCNNGLSQ